MRSDLDAARGVIWWALVPLLLLVASGSAFAGTAYVCEQVGAYSGMPEEECTNPWVERAADALAPSDLVNVWSPTTGFWTFTAAGDVYPHWYYWDVGIEGDEPWFNSGFAWESYCCGGSGGGGDGSGVELDLDVFGAAWAGAFALVFACWAIGKGVAVVVRMFRN